jgi:hypothetical protein
MPTRDEIRKARTAGWQPLGWTPEIPYRWRLMGRVESVARSG